MEEVVLIHYNEIAIKGKNRSFFEQKLINYIRRVLKEDLILIKKRYGSFYCKFKKGSKDRVEELLKKIPGIAHFSFAVLSTLDLEKIKKVSLDFIKEKDFLTFKVLCKRSYKKFKYKSMEVNMLVGEYILNNLEKKVDIKNPELKLYIEIGEKEVFIFCEKIKGLGGLPVGSSSKIICSLSGGIDSPVSAFKMIKRGCPVVFVHLYNNSLVKREVVSKIKDIVEKLNSFQLNSKLYIVPFSEIQKEIIANVNSEYRMIVYRRFMFRVINQIAVIEKCKGVVTGDSMGQVASQTLDNILSIYDVSTIPILTPLIGSDKNEIIDVAKEIGTYELSIIPYPDCCSFMISSHPQTKSKLDAVKRLEENILDKELLVDGAIKKADVFEFKI
ncbi:MAG: tRNA uracil 4-sulfurtransferase ThiI [archaeon]|nr:tRNA 4-thiouridine(8) synthase ThiI [Candidatus ainarchaeum sp.]MDD3084931.1 tRNA 4-thiouridine(8) synthase ThiI [Candidatus ainarchaeum sp.]MDD4221433.1 tRNA 4-thiouridine(8) synthase ThiI [Candidatus ainarchaeum sp.]MDD4662982.1 tRNA 4-thiouridine(8) synthase ThiI [Candidatus ainarchaeum sp.]